MHTPASHPSATAPTSAAAYRQQIDECLQTAVNLHQQGHLDEAAQLYQAVRSIEPRQFDATRLLGVLASQRGQFEQACELLASAIKLRPKSAEALYHYGLALQNSDQPRKAADIYQRALKLSPQTAQIAENLAVALVDAGREQSAIQACKKALKLNSESAIALANLGTLYFNSGDTAAALQYLQRLNVVYPTLGQARHKLATALLRQGRFAEGWALYEGRSADETFLELNPPATGAYPTWAGESLTEKTILVTPEQGVGDEIMFASCIAQLVRRAGHVVLQCDDRLQALFARSFPAVTVLGQTAHASNLLIDCCISIASLPRYLRTDASDFDDHAYLTPDPARVEYFRNELANTGHTKNVGISWRAGRNPRAQKARSIPLANWGPLLAELDAGIIDLQYGDHLAELESCAAAGQPTPSRIPDSDPLHALDDLAALISALDLVITVDNSTAHLAAALGVATWVALPAGAEWRWGDSAEKTLWYHSARLFRQSTQKPSDWKPVLHELHKAYVEFTSDAAPRYVQPVTPNQQPSLAESPVGERAVLLNDTRNWYHFGCTATSLALHSQLRERYQNVDGVPITETMNIAGIPDTLAGFQAADVQDKFCHSNATLVERLQAAEHVYVNGEGTLHGRSAGACSILFLAWLSAVRFGKPVSIINHSVYPGDSEGQALYRAVYQKLTRVAIREPASIQTMRSLGIDAVETFDSLPIYLDRYYQSQTGTPGKTAVLAGGVTWHDGAAPAMHQLIDQLRDADLDIVLLLGARAYPAGEELRFAEAVKRSHGDQVQLHWAASERDWLDTIANAQVLVSGRFHHSIAAAFLGTPLIASASNTPKMVGLMQACQLPAVIDVPSDWFGDSADRFASELCRRARHLLDDPNAFRMSASVRRELLQRAYRNFGPVTGQHSNATIC